MNSQRIAQLPPARHLAGVWLAVFCAYGVTVGGHLFSPDDELLFRTTESIATRAALDIEPIWGGFASMKGRDGRQYAQYGIGQPILAVPFYWAGIVVERFYGGAGLKYPYRIVDMQFHDRTDSAWARRFAVSWFNVALGACFAVALFVFAHGLTGELAAAWMTALLYALGTMAWPHSRTFFSEPLAALCVLGGFALLWRSVQRRGAAAVWLALAAGGCSGYALLTRLDSVLALPGIAVLLALAHARGEAGGWRPETGGRRREKDRDETDPSPSCISSATSILSSSLQPPTSSLQPPTSCLQPPASSLQRELLVAQFRGGAWRRWLAWGLPIAGAIGVYAALNVAHFGTLRPAYADQPEGINFGTPLLVGLHGFLFSIGRGLFFFSPPLVLFFWSIARFIRRWPALGWGLVASIVCFLGVQSMWINWAGGWCWGPRHIFMIHWMLALPICALMQAPRSSAARVAFGPLLIVSAGIQVYGSLVNFNTFYQTHFRELDRPPRAMALYSPADEERFLEEYYRIKVRLYGPEFEERRPYSGVIVAPINDSIFIYQNSQWAGNARCLWHGMHDFYWLHLAQDLAQRRGTH